MDAGRRGAGRQHSGPEVSPGRHRRRADARCGDPRGEEGGGGGEDRARGPGAADPPGDRTRPQRGRSSEGIEKKGGGEEEVVVVGGGS